MKNKEDKQMKNKPEFFKGREVDLENTRVFVYFNPNKDLFSVKALEGKHKGKIIIHAPALTLKGALFISNKGIKQRAITDKQNVHSGIAGYIISLKRDQEKVDSWPEINYDPQGINEFTYKDKEIPIKDEAKQKEHILQICSKSVHFSNQVHLEDKRIFCNN